MVRARGSDEFKNSDIKFSARSRARLHRYSINNISLCYLTNAADPPRINVPHDEELEYRILYEVHDTAISGHLGHEKTYGLVTQSYWWPHSMNGLALMCAHVRRANGSSLGTWECAAG